MKENINERWKKLCEQAENEKDPVKLLALVTEINRLFDEKEAASKKARSAGAE
jgi:hypothetical protein